MRWKTVIAFQMDSRFPGLQEFEIECYKLVKQNSALTWIMSSTLRHDTNSSTEEQITIKTAITDLSVTTVLFYCNS